MNKFGGNRTRNKINILVEYAQTYLSIMNTKAEEYNQEILYFDGFAGLRLISKANNKTETDSLYIFDDSEEKRKDIVGAALEILKIDHPRSFDFYYFVEKTPKKFEQLKANINSYESNKSKIIQYFSRSPFII